LLQEDAFAEATAGGAEEEEVIPELGLDKKKKKKKKREVSCWQFLAVAVLHICCTAYPAGRKPLSNSAYCWALITIDAFLQARADSEFAAEAGADIADGEEDGQENKPTGPAWEGSDRDYSYEELLGMLHTIISWSLCDCSAQICMLVCMQASQYAPIAQMCTVHPELHGAALRKFTIKQHPAGLLLTVYIRCNHYVFSYVCDYLRSMFVRRI